MRIATLTCHDATASWTERYNEGESRTSFQVGQDVQAWAASLIDHYNATLRQHELPRTLDRVEIEDDTIAAVAPEWHDWHKTNAITVVGPRGVHDTLRCDRCGITAKRYGLSNVVLDGDFKAKAFRTCAGSLALLEKRSARKS